MRSLEKVDVLAAGLVEIQSQPLRRAALDVIEHWPEGPGNAALVSVSEDLVRLAHIVEASGAVLPDSPPIDPVLLGLVRAQLLEQLQEGVFDPVEVDRLVESLESVQLKQRAAAEASAVELLGSPDGFQLVVEMAHDLRSPLSSILFLSDTLRRGQSGETNALQQKQLGLIYSAAMGLASVMNDVMELAKGGGTLRDESEQPYSLTQIVNTVLETLGPVAEEKGIELRRDIQAADHVRGFPISTSRVLLNLVNNALHHTHEGHVAVRVEHRAPAELEFSVTDTGSGIAEADRGRVFQAFKRGPDRANRGHRGPMLFSGSGLGLTIA
ncbi:MAG: sensor histidine kinase, partial [Longimicrobiales bacterium]